MARAQQDDRGEWRLSSELGDFHEDVREVHGFDRNSSEAPAALARNLSHERLEGAIHVVTVENLGWIAIAVYAALTRLVALGARPLDPVEAGHALYALDLASPGTHAAGAYYPAYAGWIHLLTAAFFEFGGVNDFTARVAFALSGLLLIAMAFKLRHYVGRAGGLALGAMLALSPSVTWFSRASAAAIPAAAMSLVTIAVFMELKARPSVRCATALGLFSGLMVAASPIGMVTGAIFVGALMPIGLWELVTVKNVGLGIRVWLDRYAKLLVIVIVTAGATCALSQWIVRDGWDSAKIVRGLRLLRGGGAQHEFIANLRFYLPVLTLYEFMIAILGLFGAIAIITFRIPSRFAAWCLVWAIMSTVFWVWTPVHNAESVIALLLPAVIVGAIGVDWLHYSDYWRLLRVPLAMIAAIGLYVGCVANFIADTADASAAPWARHGNLLWGRDTTTEQARLYAGEAAAGISPADATVFFDGEVPLPLRWYLRDLRVLPSADAATVVVSHTPSAESQAAAPRLPSPTTYHFDCAEGWLPNLATVRLAEVANFMLRGRIWGPITTNHLTITVRKPSTAAPPVIFAPVS